MTSTESYWSTLKMLLHNKRNSCIPPLRHQNKYVTDFKGKAEKFNSFFAEQCSLINNSSKLPSTFLKTTDKCISSISFSSNDIARIIRDLDPNKAHGHNMISLFMLKICGESISKPLEIIFKSCIEKGQIWFQSIKKMISKCQEAADLFHYFKYRNFSNLVRPLISVDGLFFKN